MKFLWHNAGVSFTKNDDSPNISSNIPGVETSRRDVSTLVISTTDHLVNARQHLATAKAMIDEMGYGRLRPEVEELRNELQSFKA